MTAVDLGPLEDFEPGVFSVVEIDGKQLGVLRWGAQVFVVRNVCPHAYGPICEGMVSSRLESPSVGEMAVDDDTPVLLCPWHRWEFTLPEGLSVRDPKYRLKTYPAWIEDGRVVARLRSRPAPVEV
jgi:nitrite reductase/ring-hydroxylating ferredoxin subunit